ncbi:hypothetical protein V6N12_007273 [Hibiscus sabdariffa]|uniref:Uncharacterized protein n=1 Tax=Hibiscus sabdariffa TaxID=183260 RepID=A0ABR2F196_9ROSI
MPQQHDVSVPTMPDDVIATSVPLADPSQQDVSPDLPHQAISPDLPQQDFSPTLPQHHPLPQQVRLPNPRPFQAQLADTDQPDPEPVVQPSRGKQLA